MTVVDRILRRERYLVSTNDAGAEKSLAVGNLCELDGRVYRVTRHKSYATVPWSTIDVFGIPVSQPDLRGS